MPATRSQKAALASPLSTTTRKRSVSRALSSEPAARKPRSRAVSKDPSPAPIEAAALTTTATTSTAAAKRKADDDAEEGRGAAEGPKKKARTFREKVFQEDLAKRVAERRAAKAAEKTLPMSEFAPGAYPSPSKQPGDATAWMSRADGDGGEFQYRWYKPPVTPSQATAPPQQVAQTQPQPRGFFGRLLDTITPFKRRSQTPSRDTRLPDARIDLFQLTQHAKLQQQMNSELSQAIDMEEQKVSNTAPHHEYEVEQEEQTEPGSKRKRTANETTGLPPLNIISESPEARFTDNMQTPSRVNATTYNGLVPKSLPRRRTYKDARAARGTRNPTDPPTPAVTRTAPSTPYDKNNYERIRRVREIEQLRAQQKAMQDKLAKLQAEQEAEAEAQPRKTKRVKIEHLKQIPHNLPGEPSGSFRFPEADSDDEMEVDEDAEIIDNPFDAADEQATEPKQASPTKAPAGNPFAVQPPTNIFETPAKVTSPAKKAVSPSKQAPSPLKTAPSSTTQAPSPLKTAPSSSTQAPSPLKTAPSPTTQAPSPLKTAPAPITQVTEVVEIDDDAASATTSPEPAQVFSDTELDPDFHTDAEDWPELPPRKGDEPEPPQWWKDQCYEKFKRGFDHWQATGEILDD